MLHLSTVFLMKVIGVDCVGVESVVGVVRFPSRCIGDPFPWCRPSSAISDSGVPLYRISSALATAILWARSSRCFVRISSSSTFLRYRSLVLGSLLFAFFHLENLGYTPASLHRTRNFIASSHRTIFFLSRCTLTASLNLRSSDLRKLNQNPFPSDRLRKYRMKHNPKICIFTREILKKNC